MTAPPDAAEARLQPMDEAMLDRVIAIEQAAHPHPWSRRHFADCLATGCFAPSLWGGTRLLGYLVAMTGYREAHLLNLTVAPAWQGQGWARLLLDALRLWARGQQAEQLWLEVRAGNRRARQVYERHGFETVALRKAYYPSAPGEAREDAIVMRLPLLEPAP